MRVAELGSLFGAPSAWCSRRAFVEAMKTRNEISLAQTRLHELENHVAKMEQHGDDAALFLEVRFFTKGTD